MDLMTEFTDLMSSIKEMIARFKTDGKDALSLRAMDTLIRLYSVMSQFAAVYFENQRASNEQQKEIEAEEEIKQAAKMLQVLNDQELEMFHKLQDKMLKGDPSIIVIPENQDWEKLTRKKPLTRTNPQRLGNSTSPEEKTQETEEKPPTSEDKPESDTVRPVQPTLIPGYSEHGLRLHRRRLLSRSDAARPDGRFPVDDPDKDLKKF